MLCLSMSVPYLDALTARWHPFCWRVWPFKLGGVWNESILFHSNAGVDCGSETEYGQSNPIGASEKD